MTGYTATSSVSNVVAGEMDTVLNPLTIRGADKYGVILLHGAGAASQYVTSNLRWHSIALASAIARAGIPCISATMHNDSFANDNSQTDITTAKAYLAAQTGCSSAKVHLVGASMGAALGLRWATNNLAITASFTGIIPLCDIDNLYQSNAGGLRAAIGTAWGVTHPTALPSNANLPAQCGVMDGEVPSRLYYAADDTIVPAATVTAMGTLIGAEVVQDVGNLGHTEAAIGAVGSLTTPKWQGLIDFLIENGA